MLKTLRALRVLRGKTSVACGGFTLLEVILALAILAGSIAVLAEATRMGNRNARTAAALAQAQLIASSRLAEICAGLVAAAAVEAAPIETDPGWLYSVEVEPLDVEGLLAVKVTVVEDLPEASHPARVALTCWIPDPQVVSAEQEAAESAEEEDDSSSQGSSSQPRQTQPSSLPNKQQSLQTGGRNG